MKDSYDYSDATAAVNPGVVIQEHPRECGPVSYMAFSNLKNMMHDMLELMEMLNQEDELPQWTQQAISEAADRVSKVKRFVYGRKDI